MEFIESEKLPGVFIIKPQVFGDNRGYFFQSFTAREAEKYLPNVNFVQHNESFSVQKGVLRGLHWQYPPYTQAKLIRVVQGSVFDVVVDLRPGSATFGRWEGFEINSENKLQVYIPRGFAHGFQTLTDNVIFNYLCDNYYDKSSEGGIIYNDPDIAVNWPLDLSPVMSEKDKLLPKFSEIKDLLPPQWSTNQKSSEPV